VRRYLQARRLAFTRKLDYGSGNAGSGLIDDLAADTRRSVLSVLLPSGGSLCFLLLSQCTLSCLIRRKLFGPSGKAAKQHRQAQPNQLSEGTNRALFRRTHRHFLLSPLASSWF